MKIIPGADLCPEDQLPVIPESRVIKTSFPKYLLNLLYKA